MLVVLPRHGFMQKSDINLEMGGQMQVLFSK